ncbi:MAG TPA: RagB/SusD family nutrient uptake outer membrane protein [Puia sp.]|nr:RagB/SusD family nutrient uptake outer membrane protein [Puia sp.]
MKQRILYSVLCGSIIMTASQCYKSRPIITGAGRSTYSSDSSAIGVMTGIYSSLYDTYAGANLSVLAGLSADELSPYDLSNIQFTGYYLDALLQTGTGTEFWNIFYRYIAVADSAIAGLDSATGLTPAVKTQLLGEAKFVRAFCYFYLVNLYGDCPLVTGTDTAVNRQLSRSPKTQVWNQIKADATNAQSLLSPNYLDVTLLNISGERIRPNKWAAAALLARTALYTGAYDSAEAAAGAVINNSAEYSLEASLNAVFLKNSHESIWQLPPTSPGLNTEDARYFIPLSSTSSYLSNLVYANSPLVQAFETGDERKVYWIDSLTIGTSTYFYPYKYKIAAPNATVAEYEMVFRLAEQYLIRAEARARQGNVNGAIADLNIIRDRAGLPNYTGAMDIASVVKAILHERQVELFTEWGHRWLDLKRTGDIDSVMTVLTPVKGGVWNQNWAFYPLPLSALQSDPNLVQNPGY